MSSMSSLTPGARKAEATNAAMSEGMFSGLLTLIPSTAAVYYAMQRSPRFLARTNMQSRTALAIMPAMFVFGWTAEERMTFKMREIAKEEAHSQASVRWAEEETQRALQAATPEAVPVVDREDHLMKLYQKSVQESGVRIVPGDELGVHHRMANFVSANPIKTLLTAAAPAIGLIFYGQSGKEHVKLSMKLLHTRVFGQFATLSLLMGVMGFKEYMDQAGNFITQAEADARVEEMRRVRASLLARLDYKQQAHQKQHDKLVQAHVAVVEEKRHHHVQTTPVMTAPSPQ